MIPGMAMMASAAISRSAHTAKMIIQIFTADYVYIDARVAI